MAALRPLVGGTVTVLVPNADVAVIAPEKVRDYLLSPTHAEGQHKAALFRTLGYTKVRWQQLEVDLRGLLSADAESMDLTKYGRKYLVRGLLGRHPGRRVAVVTVWIILSGEETPRFVTAYPGD